MHKKVFLLSFRESLWTIIKYWINATSFESVVGMFGTWAWNVSMCIRKHTAVKMSSICSWRSSNLRNQGDIRINADQIIRFSSKFHLNTHVCAHSNTQAHTIKRQQLCHNWTTLPNRVLLLWHCIICDLHLLSHVDHIFYTIVLCFYTLVFSTFLWEFGGMATCFLMLTRDTLICHKAGPVNTELLAQKCLLLVYPGACLCNATKVQSSALSTLASRDHAL